MGERLRPIGQTDFSGGVNIVTSPYNLTNKQARQINNMILDEHGALGTRDGMTTLSVSPNTADPIVYRGVLNTVAGTTYPFAIQMVGGTTNRLLATGADPWTTVGNFTTGYATPQSVTVIDAEVIAAGYEVPWVFNGTTITNITAGGGQTVPPGAKHAAFHLGSLWLWNTNGTTTTLDGPSSLRMADANSYTSWPNANQTFIGKDDGQVGMGMSTYTIVETGISPTSTLVLFKNYSGYQVTGVFGASNFGVQRIKSDMGCVAPRSIQFVSGFGIIRLTHKGFALYNGVDDRLISEEIRPYIFGHSQALLNVTGLNFTNIDRSWAVQSQNPPLYICACPITVGSAALNRVFVYDLIRRAWTICTFPKSFSTFALYTTPTTQPVVHAGTFSGGTLEVMFNGVETDNGLPIDWSVETKAFFMGSPMRRAYWRRMILDLIYRPNQNVTVSTALASDPTALSQTRQFSAVSGAATGSIERRLTYSIMRTTPNVAATISGSGPVTIRGIEFHGVPKPLTTVNA